MSNSNIPIRPHIQLPKLKQSVKIRPVITAGPEYLARTCPPPSIEMIEALNKLATDRPFCYRFRARDHEHF